MHTLNVSLTPLLNQYVRQQTKLRYGNASEFVRETLRERMQRETQADEEFLRSSAVGAPPGPDEKQIRAVLAIQRQVRKERGRARGS